MARLDLGSGNGTDVLGGMVNFLSSGGSPVRILTASILGVVVSPFLAFADIVSAIGTFFATPLVETASSIGSLQAALFQAPADLVSAGFGVSEDVLATFLSDSLAGLFAGPVAVGMVMLSLFLVVQYLQEAETGDAIPGLPFDIPTRALGVEEEEDPED